MYYFNTAQIYINKMHRCALINSAKRNAFHKGKDPKQQANVFFITVYKTYM